MKIKQIRPVAVALALAALAAASGAFAADAGRDADAAERASWTPAWIGVPDGLAFDVQTNPELEQTFFFVRFAEAREGRLHLILHDAQGIEVGTLSTELERGSAMLLWDGRTKDGEVAPPGRYVARMVCGDREAGAEFSR